MALDANEQKLVDDIAEHGWHCLHIGEGDGEPNFSYSVGWWETLNAPEAIIFGLPRELQHSMLWELFRQVKSGTVLSDGSKISDLIEGCDCIARPVHETQFHEYFGFGRWYRRYKTGSSEGLRAFQIFWPGKVQGLYPWQDGCDSSVRDWQPALYLPRAVGNA